jgi:hypothetical protein
MMNEDDYLQEIEALKDKIIDLEWQVDRLQDENEELQSAETEDDYINVVHSILSDLTDDRLQIGAEKCMKNLTPEVADYALELIEKYERYIRSNI